MPEKKEPITFLALGDSYTIGESVEESGRWPVQLAKLLHDDSILVASPKIIAQTGWTTDELKAAIEAEKITETYGLVSLLIGVNNQYRGEARGGYNPEGFRGEFAELLDMAIAFANQDKSRVFVVSIPDYGVTPFAADSDTAKISEEIDIYNGIKQEISLAKGNQYFDITPISREANTDASLVAADGLHPSAEMYKRWVNEVILEEIKSKLK